MHIANVVEVDDRAHSIVEAFSNPQRLLVEVQRLFEAIRLRVDRPKIIQNSPKEQRILCPLSTLSRYLSILARSRALVSV